MADTSTPGIRTVLAAMRTSPLPLRVQPDAGPVARAFVTISREGGAGGHTIGRRLIDRLNELDPAEEPWSLWDRELVEKVANDHHISRELIESIERTHRPWMQEFLSALSVEDDLAETRIYHRVAATIRTLAHHGRVVIVGRGGAFVTRNMPGGVHLRLVAPTEYRVRAMARQLNLTHDAAAEHVRQLDRERAAFYKRYWPKDVCIPEAFTLTINTAHTPDDQAVECVLPLVLPRLRMVQMQAAPDVISAAM